jgi:hypothetical protein
MQQGATNLGNKLSEMGQGLYHAVTNPAETAQRAYNAVTQNPAGVAGEMVKGAIYDPELAVGAVKPTIATAKAAGNTIAAPVRFSKGVLQGIAYPEGSGAKSSLVPINPKEYYPPNIVEQFNRGEIGLDELNKAKTTPQHLYENSPVSNWAYGMAPENAQGMKLVPSEGNLTKGVGEIVGSGIRKNPIQGLVDVGGLISGVGPLYSMAKTIPAATSAILNKATKLNPEFIAKRAAAEQSVAETAKQKSMQAAAAKIAPEPQQPTVTPVQPTPQPTGITPEFQQRMDAAGVKSPTVETPTVTPVEPKVTTPKIEPIKPEPSETISQLKSKIDTIDREMSNLHEENIGMHNPETPTPAGDIYRNQIQDMYKKYQEAQEQLKIAEKAEKEASKKAKKEAKKNSPPNVSQMMSGETPSPLSNIPKQFEYGINEHPGRVIAELKEKGQWEHKGNKYNLERLEHGQKRIQVRDSKGAVVYEKYYD